MFPERLAESMGVTVAGRPLYGIPGCQPSNYKFVESLNQTVNGRPLYGSAQCGAFRTVKLEESTPPIQGRPVYGFADCCTGGVACVNDCSLCNPFMCYSWTMSVSGITGNFAGIGVPTGSCSQANGTFVLNRNGPFLCQFISEQTFTVFSSGQFFSSPIWQMEFNIINGNPTWILFISFTSIIYTVVGTFDCSGPNTFQISTPQLGGCGNLPQFITVYPSATCIANCPPLGCISACLQCSSTCQGWALDVSGITGSGPLQGQNCSILNGNWILYFNPPGDNINCRWETVGNTCGNFPCWKLQYTTLTGPSGPITTWFIFVTFLDQVIALYQLSGAFNCHGKNTFNNNQSLFNSIFPPPSSSCNLPSTITINPASSCPACLGCNACFNFNSVMYVTVSSNGIGGNNANPNPFPIVWDAVNEWWLGQTNYSPDGVHHCTLQVKMVCNIISGGPIITFCWVLNFPNTCNPQNQFASTTRTSYTCIPFQLVVTANSFTQPDCAGFSTYTVSLIITT